MQTEKKPFDQWGLVEVMGHQKYAGRVSEETIGGASFVRVDVPECDGVPAFTKLLGAGSIFAITPTTEAIAREVGKRWQCRPINVFDLPAMQQAQLTRAAHDDELPEEDEEDWDEPPC